MQVSKLHSKSNVDARWSMTYCNWSIPFLQYHIVELFFLKFEAVLRFGSTLFFLRNPD